MPLSTEAERALGPLGRVVQYWAREITGQVDATATLVESPTVDNFAALDSNGNIKDSGVDASSFAAASHNQLAATITDLSTAIAGASLALLASVVIDGQVVTKQTVYTVPAGKTLIPFGVLFRSPSASLAGLVDLDIGGNAAAGDWIQQVTLNALTATTDYGLVLQPAQAAGPPIVPVKKTLYAAATVFGIKINTGSTGVATFTADLLGYLF
jgi:hypothetical protein